LFSAAAAAAAAGVQNAALVGGAVAWTLSSPVHATSRRRNAYFSENDC